MPMGRFSISMGISSVNKGVSTLVYGGQGTKR